VGEVLSEPLHIFEVEGLMLTERQLPGLEKISPDGLAQRGVARVIDAEQKVLGIGGLRFVVDDFLPGGIEVGDMVEFKCDRIDLW
jgi:hypothetical protein